MAEFPEIGSQCEFATCKHIDFLPFQCARCLKTFCLDHRTPDAHTCQVPEEEQSSVNPREKKPFQLYECTLKSCNAREVAEIICDSCQRQFCLKHRHQEDHSCPAAVRRETQKPDLKAALDEAKNCTAAPPKRRGHKSSEITAKVALMKLKLKATGSQSIPVADRLYFQIIMPLECNSGPTPVFFALDWKVGKSVDVLSSQKNLMNNNDKAHCKQLRLFGGETGSMFQMSSTWETILTKKDAFNGSTLILEYVDNDVTQIDVSSYNM